MLTNENEAGGNTEIDVSSLLKANVMEASVDKELSALKPGSSEYAAKVVEKFGKSEHQQPNKSDSAPDIPVKENKSSETNKTDVEDSDLIEDRVISPKEEKRINKLVAQREQAKRELEEVRKQRAADNETVADLKAQLEQLRASRKEETERPANPVQRDNSGTQFDKPKPTIGQFDSYDQYQEAFAEWTLDRREFQREQVAKQERQKQDAVKTVDSFRSRGSEVEKQLGLDAGDFEAIVGSDRMKVHTPAQYELFNSPNGARVAYEIASNEKTCADFSGASPAEQLKMIGRIEAKLDSQPENKQQPAKVRQKPSPEIRGGSQTSSTTLGDPKVIGWSAYEAQVNAQRIKEGRKPLPTGRR